MTSYWKGKKFSQEHREKLSKAKLGTHISVTRTMPERSAIHGKRISKALKRWWSIPKNRERMLQSFNRHRLTEAKGAE